MTKSQARASSKHAAGTSPKPAEPLADRCSPLLLTAPEAAEALAVSMTTLSELAKDGALPKVRFGRAVRFDRRDILALIDERKVRSAT